MKSEPVDSEFTRETRRNEVNDALGLASTTWALLPDLDLGWNVFLAGGGASGRGSREDLQSSPAMDNKEGIVEHDAPDVKAVAGIRSRITVVCAECKRLKLKCDRRSPCSSCVKRETTARCIYSAAAAEKIDVQSLHNRVSALEDSWKAWTGTQPGSTPALAPGPSAPPPPPPPPAVLVATDDISSALVGLEDVSSLWAAHLGLDLSALSLRPSSDEDDEDESDPVTRAQQVPISHRTGVTPAQLSLLPPRQTRTRLWNAAEKVLGPHAGLSARTRARFEDMCSNDGAKYSTSLLALGTAGLAIGAQVDPEDVCARALATLSYRALSPSAHDTDAVLAALLHAARGTLDGRARIAPRVWPDVCRAVGVARAMGLAVESKAEDEEWRRRVWWEVYCADLFTSDYIGLPPSIDDATFSLQLPKDEEEDAYFGLKCRLAQLIKTLKRRLLDERPLPFDGANAMERTMSEFMHDLPPAWKLDMSGSSLAGNTTLDPGSLGEEETALMLQRCELATAANSLILKAYYPFLTRNAPTAFASPHHAALACSSAAHALIHAALTAHRLLPRTRPYGFAQQLFGGAVVAASVAINSPTGLYSQLALQDVRNALGVLRELDVFNGAGAEGLPSEAVRVVEVLVSKAEGAMGVSSSVSGALKRKRSEEGEGELGVGFELPFVGAAVVTCAPDEEREEPPTSTPAVQPLSLVPPTTHVPASLPTPLAPTHSPLAPLAPTHSPLAPPERPTSEPDAPKREHRDKPKASPYPRIGVRVRNKPAKSVGPVRTKSGPGSDRESPVTPQTAGGQAQAQTGGMQAQAGGMQTQQSGGMQNQPGVQSQAQPGQAQPGGLQTPTSNGLAPPQPPQPQMTVPHQPLQVMPDQPAPYLGGTSEYPAYGDSYGQLPYLPTPVREYQPQTEFYPGYDYRGMVAEYKEGIPEEGVERQWYGHPPSGPSQQTGQWNAAFDMPAWGNR